VVTRRRTSGPDERGQAHTLEAFVAALLLVGSVVFVLQVAATTTLTASTSSQHVENQQVQVARGLLDGAVENGSLREALLRWNDSTGTFVDAGDRGYYVRAGQSNDTFGAMLDRTASDRGIAANVDVLYLSAGGDLRSRRMVHVGTPSDHATSVGRLITLYDDDELDDGPTTLNDSSSYFVPDTAEGSVHGVVRVEVTVWRT
jgi:hypothetical protein